MAVVASSSNPDDLIVLYREVFIFSSRYDTTSLRQSASRRQERVYELIPPVHPGAGVCIVFVCLRNAAKYKIGN